MKTVATVLVMLFAWLGISAEAVAQATPAPRYIKKAIFVRIHFDSSFYNYWNGRTSINSLLEGYFNDARAAHHQYAAADHQRVAVRVFNAASMGLPGCRRGA